MILPLGLEALNFAMAGAREGFGPFLGVYLQHEGFDPASTGIAMSLAGVAGVVATTPLSALVDRIHTKRGAVGIAVVAIAAGAGLIVLTKSLWVVAAGQVLIGVADTSLAPLVSAITLGIVGRARYAAQVARNETFNHGGNAVNAALSAALGYFLGLGWVALAIAVMAGATVGVVSRIDPGTIDDQEARGGDPGSKSAFRALVESRPLLVLGLAAFAFMASSGAMLPFLAQSLVKAGRDPSLVTGAMTVTVQVVMVGAAAAVPWLGKRFGNVAVLAVGIGLVAVRAGLLVWTQALPMIGVVEVLEGISMGFAGVAIPALAIDIMSKTGHANAGLGGVMTAYGAGAAVSPLLAGFVAQHAGFPVAFLTLGCVAVAGLVSWVVGWRMATRGEPAPDAAGADPAKG
ncbi:MFS transporter [Lichenibacterium minor]|uniref:MFS transporter n=1 Tax=Lichenibacterium minor TaxID=2316528 RepID=A0A4Q2UBC8_9HYPH|nr:MFS transporter [Lichenibacterium minor]RYC33348.1 MFS transporter [Lichenibacterium minor]